MRKFLFLSCVVIILSAVTKSTYGQNSQTVTSGKNTQAINFPSGCTFTWTNNTPSIGLAASGTGDISSFKAVNNTGNPIIATITAVPKVATRAYIADDKNLTVIDIDQHKLIKNIPVGNAPIGVVVNPFNNRIYVANQQSNSITVIDGATNTVIHTIYTLPYQEPSGLALSPDGSKLYATAYNNGYFLVINTADNSITSAINVGGNPWGIAVSPNGKLVYVPSLDDYKISVIDAETNQIVGSLPTSQGPNDACISPDGNYLYTANPYPNKVTVIDIKKKTIVAAIDCGGPMTLVVSPDGSKLYVSNSIDNEIAIISTSSYKVIEKIHIDNYPYGLCFSADGSKLYVSSMNSGLISVINTTTRLITSTISDFPKTHAITFGKFISETSACGTTPITYTITVNPAPPPTITVTSNLSSLTTIYGTPSATSSFTVSGADLVSGIKISAPAGFEISTDGVNFSSTITVGNEGDINNVKIFVRLIKTAYVGNYSGNVVLTAGVASANVAIPNSTITPALVTIKADNKSKPFGADNPPLTVSYNGFVNNDQASSLINLPLITTTALLTSPIGQYPITASEAASPNYTFSYLPGLLTVTPAGITMPNAFTPNGDGTNDTWAIKYIEYYPGCTVNIFSRSGIRVFSSVGYNVPWDGKLNENALPSGTYYYIIDLKNHQPAKAGWVTIIR